MSWDFQRVAIIGSGAIGLYYGGRLAESGLDVTFLARSEADALETRGLTVHSVHGDFHLPGIRVARHPEDIGPVDLVVVAWKATANDQLARVLPPLLHGDSQVLTLQNGLGNCESIAAIAGPQCVMGGLCFVCINRTQPATIAHTAGGRMSVGEWVKGLPGRAETVTRRFKEAKIPASAVSDLARAQWEKLVWNIPFNGLSIAEGGVTTDVLLSSPDSERNIRVLMNEVLHAAQAQGLELAESLVESNIERTRPMGPYRTSSMIDYLEGREVELGPIWREPLRRARAAGVEMPALESLIERIGQRLTLRS